MDTISAYLNESLDMGKYDDEIEVSFKVKGDGKISLLKMLRFCQYNGDIGHSFSIVLDPDGDDTLNTGWDGDGSDRIDDIKVDGYKLSREELKSLDKE